MPGHLADPHIGSGKNEDDQDRLRGTGPGIMTTKEAEAGGDGKFEAYLGYKASSRVTWAS